MIILKVVIQLLTFCFPQQLQSNHITNTSYLCFFLQSPGLLHLFQHLLGFVYVALTSQLLSLRQQFPNLFIQLMNTLSLFIAEIIDAKGATKEEKQTVCFSDSLS